MMFGQCNASRSPTDGGVETPETYKPNILVSHKLGSTGDKMVVFWIWTACGFINLYRCFGGTFCLHFAGVLIRFRYTFKRLKPRHQLIIPHGVQKFEQRPPLKSGNLYRRYCAQCRCNTVCNNR